MIPVTSRYYGIEVTTAVLPDGREVPCLRRRFPPDPATLAPIGVHPVAPGEVNRPDLIAAAVLGDPEQSWRLADANGAMRPAELTTEAGRVLRITQPEGLPGTRGVLGG
ncbi:hypothetical protein ACQP2F_18980 [Actinoplanes sp. CA-030573]|uniref:hypothetical protein n=1 Tax=Actinoplanes sp. CA-030573 TaxID=3239898 RepID=UPI003D8BD769